MIAVIQTGGKQYLIHEGQELSVEKLDVEIGATVSLETLLVASEDGATCEIGKPLLSKMISATVLEHDRDEKVSVIKYKPKVRYRRNVGHRQPFTKIKIGAIAV